MKTILAILIFAAVVLIGASDGWGKDLPDSMYVCGCDTTGWKHERVFSEWIAPNTPMEEIEHGKLVWVPITKEKYCVKERLCDIWLTPEEMRRVMDIVRPAPLMSDSINIWKLQIGSDTVEYRLPDTRLPYFVNPIWDASDSITIVNPIRKADDSVYISW